MIESMFGTIEVSDFGNYETRIEFRSEFDDHPLYITTIDERNLNNLIWNLTKLKEKHEKTRERRKEIMKTVNVNRIYNEMDQKYNPYPIMMSYAEAFGHALNDRLIDEETYDAIHEYYGNLWCYVGD